MKMKRKIVKSFVALILSVCIAMSMMVAANAAHVTSGTAGVSTYVNNGYGSCQHGNRAGGQYATNITNAFYDTMVFNGFQPQHSFGSQFQYTNNQVTTTALSNASTVTFFAYAGHGFGNQSGYNTFHVYRPSSGSTHTCGSSAVNFSQQNARFAHKYVTAYTCNWLTDGNNSTRRANIMATHNGTRLTMGFASTMYLDSREATRYVVEMIGNSQMVKNAFITAAQVYQPQRADASSLARIVGYYPASIDRVYDGLSAAPSYSSSTASNFGVISTTTIPYNGIKF